MAFNFNSPITQQPGSSFTYGQPLGPATGATNFFGQTSQQQVAPTQTTGFQFGQPPGANSFNFGQTGQQTGVTQPQQQGTGAFQFGQQAQQPGAFNFGQSGTNFAQSPLTGFGSPAQTNAFGQTSNLNTTFGQPSTVAPFGQVPPATGFGASSGLTSTFGQPATGTATLFSQQTPSSTFGQSPQTNAFGSTQGTTFGQANTFGQPAQTSTFGQHSTFGQTSQTNTFGQNTAFGQPAQASTFGQLGQTSTFGQPTQNTFGQPIQSTFGQPAQTNAFGQPTQTSTFGQPTQTSTFGQPTPTSTFGQTSLFGQPTTFGQPSAPGFGQIPPASSSFGQTQPLTFGQQTSAFGQPAQTTNAFGQLAQTSTVFGQSSQPLTFGQSTQSSLFGQTTTQPQTTGFTFGQSTQNAQPQTSTAFSFGQAATSAPTFSFNTPPTSTAPVSSFSFGQTATAAPSAFSFGGTSVFGTAPKPATSFNFGQSGFAQPLQLQPQQTSLFGQPQQQQQQQLMFQQQQQPQVDESHAFYQSIFQCNKFGDERDSILANFNYLQACWGTGKGHYSQTFPPVTYTSSNPFYRFKAVGYSFVFTNNNEDGFITFEIKRSSDKILAEESQLINTLQGLVNRQNILFKISGIKQLEDDLSVVNVFAEDKITLRRIPSTDLAGVFLMPQYKNQLESMGVIGVSAKIKPSPEQLKRYLENAPEGIDPRVWRQANIDNPDPVSMIPVPIVGVDALKKRVLRQENESQQHMARLNLIGEEVASLQSRHTNVTSELQQMRRKQAQLSHRLLSVIARQEMMRKQGMTLQVDEELLGKRLQTIHDRLNSPTEFKGRLSELLPQIRLHNFTSGGTKYTIDDANLAQIKEFLSIEQRSMKELVHIVRVDLDQLKVISESMSDMSSKLN